MAERDQYRRQDNRDDYDRNYGLEGNRNGRGRQAEQYESERQGYRQRDDRYDQMGGDTQRGSYDRQQNQADTRDDRYGGSWRDDESYSGGGGGERYEGGGRGSYGGARYDNQSGGFGSFNSENYGSGNVGRGQGRDSYGGGSYGGGSYGGGSAGGAAYGGGSYGGAYGPGDQRGYDPRGSGSGGRDDRGFFDKAGDEVASWFGNDEAARRREMDHRGRGPANYKRSDDRLLEDACDKLTEDWGVDARNIQVTAQDGEVTLDGTVDNRREKRRAEDVVHDISGVAHVQNNLRTTDSTRNTADRTVNEQTSERNTGTLA